MAYFLESDFTSPEGYRCVVLALDHGHRCGYVAIPRGHVLFGIEHGDDLPDHIAFITDTIMEDADVSHRGPMAVFMAALTGNTRRLDIVIDVHGSLTYSAGKDNYPVLTDADVWWFGFDCAHSGDGKDFSIMSNQAKDSYNRFYLHSEGIVRTKDYVESHCRLLSRQLWYINSMVAQSALPEGEMQ
jgi:hypothetical protein